MFALADNGEQVVIRQYREGNVTTCTTKEELNKFLETL